MTINYNLGLTGIHHKWNRLIRKGKKSEGEKKAVGLISSTDVLKKVARASSPWLVDEIRPIAKKRRRQLPPSFH